VPQFSYAIGELIELLENAKKDYYWNTDEVNRLNGLQQDFLHKLELDGLNYAERAKVATKLMKCRQDRRDSKDMVRVLDPLVKYLESDKGKNMLNLMKEVLGKTRRVEKEMEHRIYVPRELER
jgi:hypothetical protein